MDDAHHPRYSLFESSDPDSSVVYWEDAGVHQNLTFPVQPDPISGQHCWHCVTVSKGRGAVDDWIWRCFRGHQSRTKSISAGCKWSRCSRPRQLAPSLADDSRVSARARASFYLLSKYPGSGT